MCASVDSHKLQASNRAFLGYPLYLDDAEFWKRPPLDARLRTDSEGQGRSREQWGADGGSVPAGTEGAEKHGQSACPLKVEPAGIPGGVHLSVRKERGPP